MEEETEILYRATLLEKQGNQYITNFFILDKDCQTEIYHTLRNGAAERSRLIGAFMHDHLSEIRNLGIAGEHLDDQAIRWWLVPALLDDLIQETVRNHGTYEPPKRANGEAWGFVGYEITALPENTGMGQNGCGNEKNMFWCYKYSDYAMWDQCGEPEYEAVMLLSDCIRKHRLISSFSDHEKSIWDSMNGRYAHASDDGAVIPDVLVMTRENLDSVYRIFREDQVYALLSENVSAAYEKLEGILKRYSHKVLHASIGYYIRMELYAMRMMAIHDLVDNGTLRLPEDAGRSSLGMHLILS